MGTFRPFQSRFKINLTGGGGVSKTDSSEQFFTCWWKAYSGYRWCHFCYVKSSTKCSIGPKFCSKHCSCMPNIYFKNNLNYQIVFPIDSVQNFIIVRTLHKITLVDLNRWSSCYLCLYDVWLIDTFSFCNPDVSDRLFFAGASSLWQQLIIHHFAKIYVAQNLMT